MSACRIALGAEKWRPAPCAPRGKRNERIFSRSHPSIPSSSRIELKIGASVSGHSMAMLAACALIAVASVAHAQDIEPRAYSNAPVGVNFLMVDFGYTRTGA